MKSFFNILLIVLVLSSFFNCKKSNSNKTETDNKWKSLFNGENLEGWVVKINGYELHNNYLNTFRVENGILKVSYDQYDSFTDEFGHLFYN